jgi:hypothetical protein
MGGMTDMTPSAAERTAELLRGMEGAESPIGRLVCSLPAALRQAYQDGAASRDADVEAAKREQMEAICETLWDWTDDPLLVDRLRAAFARATTKEATGG